MNEGTLCIGGSLAGSRYQECPEGYIFHYYGHHDTKFYFYEQEIQDDQDAVTAMAYGYEQHCKAVAERNKPQVANPEILVDDVIKGMQDHYTASFLRSCRTCIIPSPFGESTTLTLSYGKCYKGYLNEAMEFVVYAGMENYGDPEKSMGRISNPICIVP